MTQEFKQQVKIARKMFNVLIIVRLIDLMVEVPKLNTLDQSKII